MSDAFLDRLETFLGPEGLLRPDRDLSAYEREWRGRYVSRALAVARPADANSLAQVVAWCAEHQVPMVPQGGNTGLVGGAVAVGERRQLIISLNRMRRVRSVDVDNASLTVEAGCTLEQAAAAARAVGLRLPLELASGGSATIGGVLATNAGGNQTIRFGNARAMVLGLEVVWADGRVWHGLSDLRKDNRGYELAQLLVGSEGTLGIISAATLSLKPESQQIETIWVGLESADAALALLRRMRAGLGETLTAFELISQQALEFSLDYLESLGSPVDKGLPWHVLLECDSAMPGSFVRDALLTVLESAASGGEIKDAVLATSGSQRQAFWLLRESISDAQKPGGLSLKHDISVPTARIPKFIEACIQDLQALIPGIRPCIFGHMGDGNLHFNLSQPKSMDAEAFRAREQDINECVFDRVLEQGGSIAAEHGIGLLRRERLAQTYDPSALNAMRRIKQSLDPNGLLNPGKVLLPD